MSESENTNIPSSLLKQKLYEVLRNSFPGEAEQLGLQPAPSAQQERAQQDPDAGMMPPSSFSAPLKPVAREALLSQPEALEEKLSVQVQLPQAEVVPTPNKQTILGTEHDKKVNFDVTLSMRGLVPDEKTEIPHPAGVPSSLVQNKYVKSDSSKLGGSMADLSGYKDLSKAPISFGEEDMPLSSLASEVTYERAQQQFTAAQHFVQEAASQEVDTEFSGNVKTLIRLVNELPEGVTKQTGAQIIRLTMEAMGISMEDVLSEAQSAQSEMLDAVRANIKKIEEYKTVIRKLETDIKYYQGKANELSEIIDLFILSNTSSGNKMSMPDDMGH